MRVVWKGKQKGKKGERQRKERGREEEKHSVLLGLLARFWAGWVAFGLWEQLKSQLLDHSDCMSKSGSAWHICRYGWNVPLTLGSETMCHSGRQETELNLQGGKRSSQKSCGRLSMSAGCPVFPGSITLSGFEEVPYLRGERGQRKPHVKNSKFTIRI